MLYQLPSGKTQKLTVEQFLSMSDEDLKTLEGKNTGYEINDPFFDSALDESELPLDGFDLPEDVEEIPEDYKEPED